MLAQGHLHNYSVIIASVRGRFSIVDVYGRHVALEKSSMFVCVFVWTVII